MTDEPKTPSNGEHEQEETSVSNDLLYTSSAKLLHIDGDSWQEHSVGEVTLLRIYENEGTVVRLYFFEKDTSKVVCRVLVSDNAPFNELERSSNKSITFLAMDSAEDVADVIQIGLRFASTTLTDEFQAHFERAKLDPENMEVIGELSADQTAEAYLLTRSAPDPAIISPERPVPNAPSLVKHSYSKDFDVSRNLFAYDEQESVPEATLSRGSSHHNVFAGSIESPYAALVASLSSANIENSPSARSAANATSAETSAAGSRTRAFVNKKSDESGDAGDLVRDDPVLEPSMTLGVDNVTKTEEEEDEVEIFSQGATQWPKKEPVDFPCIEESEMLEAEAASAGAGHDWQHDAALPDVTNAEKYSGLFGHIPNAKISPVTELFDDMVRRRSDLSADAAGDIEVEVTEIPGWEPSMTLEVKNRLTTGEEDEELLYCHRAKLLRMRNDDWKERGLGDARLLKSENGTVRFVMRQEKTGKIVANFLVLDERPYCQLVRNSSTDKAWVFCAMDCSEEEHQVEQFCLRFRHKTIADEFKEAFDAAKLCDSAAAVATEEKAAPLKKVGTPTLSSREQPLVPSFSSSTTSAPTSVLFSSETHAVSSVPAIATAAATTSTLFSATSGGGTTSLFGGLFSSTSNSDTTSGGLFGNLNSAGLFASAASTANEENKDEAEADLEAEVTVIPGWTPSVTLDVKDKVETGEEHEEVLFCQRSKLFRFRDNEWKQRGLGLAKLLRDPTSHRVRFLMRQENTEKVVANCLLVVEPPYYELSLAQNSDNKWIWLAQDCCDEDGTVTEQFCLKLKDKTIADEFYQAFEKAKRGEGTALSPSAIGANTKPLAKSQDPAPTVAGKGASKPKEEKGGLFGAGKHKGNLFGTEKDGVLLGAEEKEAGWLDAGDNSFFGGAMALFSGNSGAGNAASSTKNVTCHEQDADDRVEEEEVTHIPGWEPSISLQVCDDVTSGEEHEDKIYAQRSRIYRFRDSQWKERGTGEARFLKNKGTGKIRFLLRQEQTEKLVANFMVVDEPPYCQLSAPSGSEKCWVWMAQDWSEGEMIVEQFYLKFGQKYLAEEFKRFFDAAKKGEVAIRTENPPTPPPKMPATVANGIPLSAGTNATSLSGIKNSSIFDANVKNNSSIFDTNVKNNSSIFDTNVKNTSSIFDTNVKNSSSIFDTNVKNTGSIFDTNVKNTGSIFDTSTKNKSIFDSNAQSSAPTAPLFASGANAIPLGTRRPAYQCGDNQDGDWEVVNGGYVDDPVAMEDFEGLWVVWNEDGEQEERARIENGYLHYLASPFPQSCVLRLRNQDTCEVLWPNGEEWVGFLRHGELIWDDEDIWFKKEKINKPAHWPSATQPHIDSSATAFRSGIQNSPEYWKCTTCGCSWMKKIMTCASCESPQPGVDPEKVKKENEEAQKSASASFLGTPTPSANITSPFLCGATAGAGSSTFTFGAPAPAAAGIAAKPAVFGTPSSNGQPPLTCTPASNLFSSASPNATHAQQKPPLLNAANAQAMQTTHGVVPPMHNGVVPPMHNGVVPPMHNDVVPPMHGGSGVVHPSNVPRAPGGNSPMNLIAQGPAMSVDQVRTMVQQIMHDELQQRDMEIVQLTCHVEELRASQNHSHADESQSQRARLHEAFKKLGEVDASTKTCQRNEENLMRRQESKFHQMESRIDELVQSVSEVLHTRSDAEMEQLRSTNRMLLAKVEALEHTVARLNAKSEKSTVGITDTMERLNLL